MLLKFERMPTFLYSYMVYKIVLFFFLLGLFSFTPVKQASITDPSVIGKWHCVSGYRFERSGKETLNKTWYEFKRNGRVYFSSCTDACGCMRKILRGKWSWEGNSIINITFDKSKREMTRRVGYRQLSKPCVERLIVRRVDKNGLIITPHPIKLD